MRGSWRELIGWYGVVAILVAYIGVNFSKLDQQSLAYLILNLSGAVAVGFDAWKQKNYQPVLLNIVWAVVAIWGLLQLFW